MMFAKGPFIYLGEKRWKGCIKENESKENEENRACGLKRKEGGCRTRRKKRERSLGRDKERNMNGVNGR